MKRGLLPGVSAGHRIRALLESGDKPGREDARAVFPRASGGFGYANLRGRSQQQMLAEIDGAN